MFRLLRQDLEVAGKGWGALLWGVLIANPLGALFWVRLQIWLNEKKLPAFLPFRVLRHVYGMEMGPHCKIGGGLYLPHPFGVMIAHYTEIGERVTLYGMVRFLGAHGKSPRLGNDVLVGDGARLIGGVTIGDGTAVGAGAVVTHSFGENLVVAGNPARVIKERRKKE